MKGIIGALALAVTLGWHGAAKAEFQIQVRQVSPNQIEVTGSGTAPALPDGAASWGNLFLESVRATSELASFSDSSGDLGFSALAAQFTEAVVLPSTDITLTAGQPVSFSPGAVLAGTATYSFGAPVTLAAVGTTGTVSSRADDTVSGAVTLPVGSWTVVPLPAGVWLMVSGLAAVGGLGRWLGRRRPEAAPAAA